MIKVAKDINILTDAQVDEMIILLEAAWVQTGNKTIFKLLEILLKRHV